MKVIGDYHANGYAHVEQLIGPDIAQAFVAAFKKDVGEGALPVSTIDKFPNLLTRPAFEVYGHFYPPMLFFLWGLTPIMNQIVGVSCSRPTTISGSTARAIFAGCITIARRASTACR
jgi:hypothetical protein